MVKTPLFSGPVAVLLNLVTDKELDIYELCLKDIVDAYIAELEQAQVLNLEEATELLMVVAILIELKSRWLLPNEGEEELEDLPDVTFDLLISRMMECKTFKAVAQEFENMKAQAEKSHPRCYGLDQKFIEMMPDLLLNVKPTDLKDAYVRATTPKNVLVFNISHLSPITRTVMETVDELRIEIKQRQVATFRELTEKEDRIGVVFCFLAILELYKYLEVEITQANTFGEIQITWNKDER